MDNKKVKIGVLNINQGYDEVAWYVDTFEYGKIRENLIDSYTEIYIESIEELFGNLYNYLQPSEHTVLNITDLAYTKNSVIQGIYNICVDINTPNYNKLASQLTHNINVEKSMILIKRDLSDSTLKYIDFDISDLIELIKNTFVHTGLIIKPNTNFNNNSEIIEYPYINDILEAKIEEYTFKNIRYNEHKFIDYTLTFYSDITASRDETNLNIIASTIYGKKIYGEVYLTLTTTREDYVNNLNINKELLHELYYIYATKSQEINFKKYVVKPIETTSDLNNNGFPAVTYYPNFFLVIHSEYNSIKNKNIIVHPNTFAEILNDLV